MLVGITGPEGSGRKTAIEYLETQGLQVLEYNEDNLEAIVSRWQEHFVTLVPKEPHAEIRKRPWFLHLNIDAPDALRVKRLETNNLSETNDVQTLETRLLNARSAHINIINGFSTKAEFHEALKEVDILNKERVRPSWDKYFMTIADLAAQRSNCMKRRVGCVLVSDNRIVATGYNGTPRGLRNCNDGGCPRCNLGSKGGALLSTCLCLHAEENALLEAGRFRVCDSILYCNTCPCLTCSIKIVQTGVCEVVYSQNYSMDEESARVLKEGGVKLRKFTNP